MTRSLVALWSILLAAILTIAVLAQFWINQRQRSAQQRVEEILLTRLAPYDDAIKRIVETYSVGMQRTADLCDLNSPQSCVDVLRSPLVGSLIVVDAESRLVYPQNISSASKDRQSLIDEAQQLLKEMADPRPLARRTSESVNGATNNLNLEQQAAEFDDLPIFNSRSYANRQQNVAEVPTLEAANSLVATQSEAESTVAEHPTETAPNVAAKEKEFGWITWYHRRGMVLGFWWSQGPQRRAIATIPRARWMADIVAALPDSNQSKLISKRSDASSLQQAGLNQLIDVEGNVIYQWGVLPDEQWTVAEDQKPDAVQSVSAPLEGWRIRIYAPPALRQRLAGDNVVFPLWLAVGGLTLALLLAGALVTTSFNRQMRHAARRVSFVNQVSHELRTPLTNICMYADLLAKTMSLEESENTGSLKHVAVIQNESQRLSRLIGNVLQFARSESQPSELHLREGVVDEVIRDAVRIFEPSLRELEIEVSMHLNAAEGCHFDPDVVERILVNLVGNAEKYAASGKRLEISSGFEGDQVDITVRDYGPGIPARMADRIFQPFVRVSDRLEDPAGTGIGLTIVRDLARRHGGDCILKPTREGAAFSCKLRVERTHGQR